MQPALLPAAQTLIDRLADVKGMGGDPVPGTRHFHVASIGTTFYFAYEQLRNVAEYREHHLLLRSAIERFLRRYVHLDRFRPVGADLVTELTQAGYLPNDTVTYDQMDAMDAVLQDYARLYREITTGKVAEPVQAASWIYQVASVHLESRLAANPRGLVVLAYAFEHYLGAIVPPEGVDRSSEGYRIALLCAVQRIVFKSDQATTRYYCLAQQLANPEKPSAAEFVALNRSVDELYVAPLANQLARLINRYGAPMRMLRVMITEASDPETILANRQTTLTRLRAVCQQQYASVFKRLTGRIVRTILFILITKTVIGVGLEVPFDLALTGAIQWLPLLVNIGFPPLYMALIGFTIGTPSRHNTEAIASLTDRMLYATDQPPVEYKAKRRVLSGGLNRLFMVVYVLGFSLSFGLLGWLLYRLDFNVLSGLIFFIFFSAVSFLGFRLRQSVRELQLLDERPNLLQTLTDFLQAPFVRVGHWLSDHYAKANLVTLVLDTVIELPFKTTLRLIQQWSGFIRDRQEEL